MVAGVVVAGGMVVSVLGSVIAAVAALVATLVWALAAAAGAGALAWAGVVATREVLAYRADQRDAQWVLTQLAARGIPLPPPAHRGAPQPVPCRQSRQLPGGAK